MSYSASTPQCFSAATSSSSVCLEWPIVSKTVRPVPERGVASAIAIACQETAAECKRRAVRVWATQTKGLTQRELEA